MENKFNSNYAEIIAKWYLRFNGYFIVDNFIVHAGDDPGRITKDKIGNHTETDILAIRHKFSKEISGKLNIENDPKIINKEDSNIDFVIAEVKTGKQDKPNKLWTENKISVIEYILRFAGFIETENKLKKIATELCKNGFYNDSGRIFSIRLVLISEIVPNKNWQHISNILIDDIINFIVDVRGQCWVNENIGTASIHYQWDGLINKIFDIANNQTIDLEERKKNIRKLLLN
jgi:hypothetical protein